VARAKILEGLVPNIIGYTNNFYKYQFVEGELYSRVVIAEDFAIFLNWTKDNLWKKNDLINKEEFGKACLKFYHDKTDERVKNVCFTEDVIIVDLMDGRTISVPIVWYPRLLNGTKEQLAKWEICGGGYGIHWEELDEDLNTEGMLRGAPAPKLSK
jgi:hypothetical protein